MNAAGRFALVLLLFWTSGSYAQQHFPSAESAGEALVQALANEQSKSQQLVNLLGSDWKSYIPTENVDRDDVDAFLSLYRERHLVQLDSPDRAHLVVGEKSWVFPIPIKHVASGWAFDTRAGAEEIRLRRIGRLADGRCFGGGTRVVRQQRTGHASQAQRDRQHQRGANRT